MSSFVAAPSLAAAKRRQPAGLLVPLSGASAALGLSMQRAAALVQPIDGRDAQLFVLDTGSTAEGAQAAARQAIRRA